MKKFKYAFSDMDRDTFICTLTVYIEDFNDLYTTKAQNQINSSASLSAIQKLLKKGTNFTPNEIRMMSVSLMVADMVLKGQLNASDEVKKLFSQHIFTINKLLPIFSKIID